MPELHLNLFEALWLLVNVVAFYFTALNYDESKRQKIALHPLVNGRLIIVNGNLRRDRNRLIKILAMIAVGVYAALLPGEVQNPTWILVLMLVPAILAYDSVADNRDRRHLVRKKMEEVLAETQDQREDREFGDKRRALEAKHNEALPDGIDRRRSN